MKFLDDSGNFGPGNIQLSDLVDSEKPLSSDFYKKCNKFAQQANLMIDLLPSKCNGAALKFSICMAVYIFTSCPNDKKSTNQQCSIMHTMSNFVKPMLKMWNLSKYLLKF